jgi:hypothetical protein
VIDLTGSWTGALPIRTPGGADWSLASVSLVQSAEMVTGELVSRNDVKYPLTGTVSQDGASLTVGGLPRDSSCGGIILVVTRFEFRRGRVQRLLGHGTGRCFGTIAGNFQLERVS